MITEEEYLKAEKTVREYKEQQFGKATIMSCFPSMKERKVEYKRVVSKRYFEDEWQNGGRHFSDGFAYGYNWIKREFEKQLNDL